MLEYCFVFPLLILSIILRVLQVLRYFLNKHVIQDMWFWNFTKENATWCSLQIQWYFLMSYFFVPFHFLRARKAARKLLRTCHLLKLCSITATSIRKWWLDAGFLRVKVTPYARVECQVLACNDHQVLPQPF